MIINSEMPNVILNKLIQALQCENLMIIEQLNIINLESLSLL